MAKLCSSYGSSPSFSFLSEEYYGSSDILGSNNTELGLSNTDLGLINPDPAELFEDVNLLNDCWPTSSIHSDIQKMKLLDNPIRGALLDNCILTSDIKSEIRNMDCMWSSSTSILGTSASSSLSDSVTSSTGAVPLAEIINNNNNSQQCDINNKAATTTRPPPVVVIANNINNIINNNKNKNYGSSSSSSCNNSQLQQQQFVCIKREIKEEPIDDYEQTQLQSTTTATANCKNNNEQISTCMQNIPAGASLLRNNRKQQQIFKQNNLTTATTNKSNSIHIPKMYAGEFVRERDQLLTTTSIALHQNKTSNNNNNNKLKNKSNNCAYAYMRPDTPHSLDDDVAHSKNNNNKNNKKSNIDGDQFFKHNIDLHACVIGSNNISLTADPTNFINHVSQELQDTSKTQIDMRYVSAGCSSLAEVTEVLEGMATSSSLSSNSLSTTTITKSTSNADGGTTTASSSGIDCDSEDSDTDAIVEDEETWHVGGESTRCSIDSMLDTAEAPELSAYVIHTTNNKHHHHNNNKNNNSKENNNAASPVPSQDSLMSVGSSCSSESHKYTQQPPYSMHSDHSYTRCKDGMDDLGPSLETPSDSDEEIDVVSIGDKKLPTNPSDKDRRALQTKVAYKFSNARIVKTQHGVRTIPPRRRVSYELPYTPASSSPVKSVANSRYPSPTSTPAHVVQQQQYTSRYVQQQLNMMQTNNVMDAANTKNQRKRLTVGITNNAGSQMGDVDMHGNGTSNMDYALPPHKKQRGKKQGSLSGNSVMPMSLSGSSTPISKRNYNTASPIIMGSGSSSSSSCGNNMEEASDTVEKRNLHNDMERQRRIGLKNLFEALKKQIPSIKDKERAPKVNILREAAKLCEALTREDQAIAEQKALLKEQTRKFQEELARLRNSVSAVGALTMTSQDSIN